MASCIRDGCRRSALWLQGKREFEGRAGAEFALNKQLAAVGPGDPLSHREAQPRALGLAGHVGIENLLDGIGRKTRPVVLDLDLHHVDAVVDDGDDDGDDDVDCADSDCAEQTCDTDMVCRMDTCAPATEATCDNDADNDMDGDTDVDIVSASYSGEIAWWENDGAGSFSKHSISTTFAGPLVVDASDLDEDGEAIDEEEADPDALD